MNRTTLGRKCSDGDRVVGSGHGVSACVAFVWFGQDFAHCDRCGLDLSEHRGMEAPASGTGPFDDSAPVVVSFEEMAERSPLFRFYTMASDGGLPRWAPVWFDGHLDDVRGRP